MVAKQYTPHGACGVAQSREMRGKWPKTRSKMPHMYSLPSTESMQASGPLSPKRSPIGAL